jgi:hypothetical protein
MSHALDLVWSMVYDLWLHKVCTYGLRPMAPTRGTVIVVSDRLSPYHHHHHHHHHHHDGFVRRVESPFARPDHSTFS